jgi:peptidoglycan/LPS O-acetylase OafA/YrhL
MLESIYLDKPFGVAGFLKSTTPEKLQVVDLVRSFSILAVLAYHLNFVQPLGVLPAWAWALWRAASNNGHMGVSVFFVISGFLITRLIAREREGLWKPDLKNFYVRRVGRIIPLLTLVCLAGAWMIYHAPPLTEAYEHCFKTPEAVIGPTHWLAIVTFTFNWYITLFCAHPYLGLQWDILWSLSIEEQFYFFYPLLLRYLKKETALVGFLFFFIFFGLVTRGINIFMYPEKLSYNSFQNFDMIALGCLLYLATERWGNKLHEYIWMSWSLTLVGLVLAAAVYLHISPGPELWSYWFGRFLLGLGVFMFLLGAFAHRGFESKYLNLSALPGRLSYGMYLLHPLVLYFMWGILKTQNVWVNFFSFTVITTLISYLSFRLFEMPMNFWIRKKFGGETMKAQ